MTEDSPTYNTGATGQVEMPRYVSCKPVWALKIKAITFARQAGEDGSLLHYEHPGFAPRFMQADWMSKRGAQPGGWMVAYTDGYLSWSPADAFEKSSVPEAQWGLTRTQEPKYTINMRGQLAKRHDQGELPPDEPLFVLRAQDVCAIAAISAYRAALPENSKARDSCDERMLAFSAFQQNHPERMKHPDSEPAAASDRTLQRWAPGERERLSGDDTAT